MLMTVLQLLEYAIPVQKVFLSNSYMDRLINYSCLQNLQQFIKMHSSFYTKYYKKYAISITLCL